MSRLEWFISGVLGLLIVVGAAAFMYFSAESGADAGSQDSSDVAVQGSGHSARSAYEVAAVTAREWTLDAQLLSATASWPAGSAPFAPGAAGWGFQFYSAAQQSTALIAVSDGQARIVRSNKATTSLAPLNIDGWLVDSPQIIESVMAEGGQQFLEHNNAAALILTLNLVDQFQWKVRLIDTETNKSFQMTINPASGVASAPITPTVGE